MEFFYLSPLTLCPFPLCGNFVYPRFGGKGSRCFTVCSCPHLGEGCPKDRKGAASKITTFAMCSNSLEFYMAAIKIQINRGRWLGKNIIFIHSWTSHRYKGDQMLFYKQSTSPNSFLAKQFIEYFFPLLTKLVILFVQKLFRLILQPVLYFFLCPGCIDLEGWRFKLSGRSEI